MIRVVLDTNVLITAFKDEYSYQKQIIDEAIKGNIQAFANNQTLRENSFILKKLIHDTEYQKELDRFLSQVNIVQNKRKVHIVSDPEDNKILESALEAKADYLITEDKALLELKKVSGVKIVEPADFWVGYQESTGNDPWKKWVSFVAGDKNGKN
ncbi:MAG: putative toxin-antitoxin system toxin component, PIN family [Candidatus Doudnabacteria bacterium]